jgi:membrane protein YdbS with pleckstrin-like domain
LVGVWLMRIGERTSLAHTLRGICVFVMLLLGIGTAVSFYTMPRVSIASGIVLALMAVLAVVDCRREARI